MMQIANKSWHAVVQQQQHHPTPLLSWIRNPYTTATLTDEMNFRSETYSTV
jgi:hypothetical protein